jgi:hypothetical protein
MIVSDPGFFPAYNSNREAFTWYNRDNFLSALRGQYSSLEMVESHPASRTLIFGRR